jgi:hypothetical protein
MSNEWCHIAYVVYSVSLTSTDRTHDYATVARSKYRSLSNLNASGQAVLKKITRKDVFVKQADMKFA